MDSKALIAILAWGAGMWGVPGPGFFVSMGQETSPGVSPAHNTTYQLYQLGLKVNEHAVRLTQFEERLADVERAVSQQSMAAARRSQASAVASGVGSRPADYDIVRPDSGSNRHHRVAKGENLTLIARRHGVTIRSIVEANGLRSPDRIQAGQLLRIPGASDLDRGDPGIGASSGDAVSDSGAGVARGDSRVHVVRPRETLFGIARDHGISLRELQTYNAIPNPAEIWPGQQIRIPGDESVPVGSDPDWGKTVSASDSAAGGPVDDASASGPDAYRITSVDESESTAASASAAAVATGIAETEVAAAASSTHEMDTQEVATGRDVFGYFVVTGDTVEGLARVFGTTAERLRALNDLSPEEEPRPGRQILIPAEAIYGS